MRDTANVTSSVGDSLANVANPVKITPFCVDCKGGHWINKCPIWARLSVAARRAKAKAEERCQFCLRQKHKLQQCHKLGEWKCYKCKRQHHSLLCDIAGKTVATLTAEELQAEDILTSAVVLH